MRLNRTKFIKYFFISFVLFFSFPSTSILAKPFIGDLKKINLLKPNFFFLNPSVGLVWTESKAIENFGEIAYEAELQDLKAMISHLYHRVNVDEYGPSRSETGLANYLDPQLIGHIIGYVYTSYKPQQSAVAEIIETYITPQLNQSIKRGGEPLDKRTKKQIKKKSRKILNLFLSHKSDPKFYAVFLSILWQKAEKKEDILKYYRALRSKLGKKAFKKSSSFIILAKEGVSRGKFKKLDEKAKIEKKKWLEERFKSSDLGLIKSIPPLLSDYEKRLFWTFSRIKNSFPLEQQKHATVDGLVFADCGASSLKNFFKLILDKNGKKIKGSPPGDYETRILRALNGIPELTQFFQTYNTRALQKTQEARNAWARLTCKREGVKYVRTQERCEISSKKENGGGVNMLNLINQLLFHDRKETKARTWQELATRISHARKVLMKLKSHENFRLSLWEGDPQGHHGVLTLEIKGYPNKFNWKFQKGHFFMEATTQQGVLSKNLKNFLHSKSPLEREWALHYLSIYPSTGYKIEELTSVDDPAKKYFTDISGESMIIFMLKMRGKVSISHQVQLYKNFKKTRAIDNEDLLSRLLLSTFPVSLESLVQNYRSQETLSHFPMDEFN